MSLFFNDNVSPEATGERVQFFEKLTQGPAGPMGPQGVRGPEGPKGERGEQGIPGVSTLISYTNAELPSDATGQIAMDTTNGVPVYFLEGYWRKFSDDTIVADRRPPTGWTPAEIATLSLWLDAADGATISLSGSNVVAWLDKSLNKTVEQPIASRQPIYDVTGMNGAPALIFDGIDDYLPIQPIFGLQQGSVFIVMRMVADSAFSGDSVFEFNNASTNSRVYIPTYSTATALRVYDSADRSAQANVSTWDANRVLSGLWQYGDALEFGIDGGARVSTALGAGTATWMGQNQFIAANRGLSAFFPLVVAEFICYDSKISFDDSQKVEGHLAHKWGLQSNLPTNHPYKISPP